MMQRRLTIRVSDGNDHAVEFKPLELYHHKAPSEFFPSLAAKIPSKVEQSTTASSINNQYLGQKIVGDVLVAFGVTLGVAPFVSVVDKAIVERSNGKPILSSGAESLRTMVRNPIQYLKSPMFLMMWGVYGVTYATANSLKTIVEHQEQATKASQLSNSGKLTVFGGTAIVNSASSLMKDRAYARMFGTSGAANIPMISYGLWSLRDAMVIGSSFVLPELVGKKLQQDYNLNKDDALKISQLTVPIATQFFAAPVQLLGLDFYNRPMQNAGFMEAAIDRTRFLANGFWSVVGARVARIFPAYSIGGVLNTKFRDSWRESLMQREITQYDGEKSNAQAVANRLVDLVADKQAS